MCIDDSSVFRYAHEAGFLDSHESAEFTPDLTPIMVAAFYNHYTVVKMLLGMGHSVEKPHPPHC